MRTSSNLISFLGRLMRITIPGLFAEPAPQEYAHTPNSLIYMDPGFRAVYELM
jgi:hypothetical protein